MYQAFYQLDNFIFSNYDWHTVNFLCHQIWLDRDLFSVQILCKSPEPAPRLLVSTLVEYFPDCSQVCLTPAPHRQYGTPPCQRWAPCAPVVSALRILVTTGQRMVSTLVLTMGRWGGDWVGRWVSTWPQRGLHSQEKQQAPNKDDARKMSLCTKQVEYIYLHRWILLIKSYEMGGIISLYLMPDSILWGSIMQDSQLLLEPGI